MHEVKKKGGKIYLNKNISIKHEGAGSVNKVNALELEKNRNWHGCGQHFIIIKNTEFYFSLYNNFSETFQLF